MCDGGYDGGGYSDPDYYDLEFRQQNPEIYGNDEYMQDYYSNSRYSSQRQPTTRRQSRAQKITNDRFHEEYLQWRRNHPDKIAFFREKSMTSPQNGYANSDSVPLWLCIIVGLIVYPLIIMTLIDSCSN